MPDGSLTMPAVAHDDQIASYNLFFQMSSGIVFGYTGAAMVVGPRWNCSSTVTRTGAGVYRVVCGAFDVVDIAAGAGVAIASGSMVLATICSDTISPVSTVFKAAHCVRVDNVTIDVYVRKLTDGTAVDLENVAGTCIEHVHLLVIGRRANALSTPFATYGAQYGTTPSSAQLNGT